jgi:hypothetical protein
MLRTKSSNTCSARRAKVINQKSVIRPEPSFRSRRYQRVGLRVPMIHFSRRWRRLKENEGFVPFSRTTDR